MGSDARCETSGDRYELVVGLRAAVVGVAGGLSWEWAWWCFCSLCCVCGSVCGCVCSAYWWRDLHLNMQPARRCSARLRFSSPLLLLFFSLPVCCCYCCCYSPRCCCCSAYCALQFSHVDKLVSTLNSRSALHLHRTCPCPCLCLCPLLLLLLLLSSVLSASSLASLLLCACFVLARANLFFSKCV